MCRKRVEVNATFSPKTSRGSSVEGWSPPAPWLPHLGLDKDDEQQLLIVSTSLNDKIVNASQHLLKNNHPHISGLQNTLSSENLSFCRTWWVCAIAAQQKWSLAMCHNNWLLQAGGDSCRQPLFYCSKLCHEAVGSSSSPSNLPLICWCVPAERCSELWTLCCSFCRRSLQRQEPYNCLFPSQYDVYTPMGIPWEGSHWRILIRGK